MRGKSAESLLYPLLSKNIFQISEHGGKSLSYRNFLTDYSLTFSLHAHGETFLVAAVLAAVPLTLVHHTVFVISACVAQVFSNSALKKAFTSLTTVYTIVLT